MTSLLPIEEVVEELLYEGKFQGADLDHTACAILELLTHKATDNEAKDRLNQEMIKKLMKQNESYKPLLDAVGFNFDDLSKSTKETAEEIAEIAALLKVRIPDDTTLISEFIQLQKEEFELKERLRQIKKTNATINEVRRFLDLATDKWDECSDSIKVKIGEYDQFKRDVTDRVEDILKPKNSEYVVQTQTFDKLLSHSGLKNELECSNLQNLYEKLATVEAENEFKLKDYGDITSIPSDYDEGVKILQKKEAKLEELERQIKRYQEQHI